MLLRLTRDERGFTMVTVMGALLIVTLLAVTALSYATDDLPHGARDRDRKIAYAAAEAGAQNYLYFLSQDPNYWAKCVDASVGSKTPQINQRWDGTGADTRRWVKVPDSRNAWYTIELLPANGQTKCSATNAEASIIDKTTGTFRIRTTGRVGENGVKRSIVTNLKRQSLLDYIYFTDKETSSPLLYPAEVGNRDTRTPSGCTTECETLKQWALHACDRYYGNDTDGQRQNQTFKGEYRDAGTSGPWSSLTMSCNVITFIDPDVVAGPFHTNDEFLCSGSPDFGTTAADRIETSTLGQTADPAAGFRGCTPHFIGTHVKNAPELALPKTNEALHRDTAADYRFVGYTNVKLNGTTMTVSGTRENGQVLNGASMPIPADGVVFVSNSAPDKPAGTPTGYPCGGYDPVQPYAYRTAVNNACGNLEVQGSYSVNVTFTAENDIIVTGDLTRPSGDPPNPDVLLGLISNNFIRVYHPVDCGPHGCNYRDTCSNADDSGVPLPFPLPLPVPLPVPLKPVKLTAPGSITIDAAILSLNHSFITDNYFCGDNLGSLTVRGAIIQKFRGPVGRGSSGYIKNYSYDTRFRYRSPPKFLDPVQAAWRIQTYNEQVPAR